MMSQEEREYREGKYFAEEFMKKYEQLNPWHKFEVRLFLDWLILRHRIRTLPARWVEFQLKMENEIKLHGMPYRIKRLLMKWFNMRPWADAEYFLIGHRKIWYVTYEEDNNFELHLYYRDRFPGNIWLQPEKDGTATIIGIHIDERFRNAGLGTLAFQKSVEKVKNRVTCIRGVLEREYYPDPEPSLRWLNRQGFQTTRKMNGDFDLELWIN